MKLEDISKAQSLVTQLAEYKHNLECLRAIDPSGKGKFVFRYKSYEQEIIWYNQPFVTTSIGEILSSYFDKEINRIVQEIDAL